MHFTHTFHRLIVTAVALAGFRSPRNVSAERMVSARWSD